MGGTDFFDDDLSQRRGAVKSTTLGGTEVISTLKPDELPARPISDLNLTRMARHREEMNTQVATAKLEIERLRRKQGEIEREKQTIEEIIQKQEQYDRGKQEMADRLAESMIALQKLEEHAARQVEIYSNTRRRFSECIAELQNLNDSEWTDDTFREELTKAVVQIDEIRKEFVKAQAVIEAAGGPAKLFDDRRPRPVVEDELDTARGFGDWMKIGLAVSLPLIVVLAVAVLIFLVARR